VVELNEILTLVPARGGSKGVRNKNIRMCGGKPLIDWTTEAAYEAGLSPYVSTEDLEIAELVDEGAVPVIHRPPELAQDDTPTLPVVQHFLGELRGNQKWILLLQPTNPLRTAEDIKAAISLASTSVDSVVSVHEIPAHHPKLIKRISEERWLYPFYTVPTDQWEGRRQDLRPKAYIRDGGIYLTRRDIIEGGSMTGTLVRPYIIPEERSVSIDTEMDLAFADFLLRGRHEKETPNTTKGLETSQATV